MKKIRKLIACVLAFVLVIGLDSQVFAAETIKGIQIETSNEKNEGCDDFLVTIIDDNKNNITRDYARNYSST